MGNFHFIFFPQHSIAIILLSSFVRVFGEYRRHSPRYVPVQPAVIAGVRRPVPNAHGVPAVPVHEGRERRAPRPWRVRPRDRRRHTSLQVIAGRTERVDRVQKRRAVQRRLFETRVG